MKQRFSGLVIARMRVETLFLLGAIAVVVGAPAFSNIEAKVGSFGGPAGNFACNDESPAQLESVSGRGAASGIIPFYRNVLTMDLEYAPNEDGFCSQTVEALKDECNANMVARLYQDFEFNSLEMKAKYPEAYANIERAIAQAREAAVLECDSNRRDVVVSRINPSDGKLVMERLINSQPNPLFCPNTQPPEPRPYDPQDENRCPGGKPFAVGSTVIEEELTKPSDPPTAYYKACRDPNGKSYVKACEVLSHDARAFSFDHYDIEIKLLKNTVNARPPCMMTCSLLRVNFRVKIDSAGFECYMARPGKCAEQ